MTQWVAMNIAFSGGYSEIEDLWKYDIRVKEHENEGFDLLMYKRISRDMKETVVDFFCGLAEECGEIEDMIAIAGCDTAGTYDIWRVSPENRDRVNSWNRQPLEDSWQKESYSDVLQRIYDEEGRFPTLGGGREEF